MTSERRSPGGPDAPPAAARPRAPDAAAPVAERPRAPDALFLDEPPDLATPTAERPDAPADPAPPAPAAERLRTSDALFTAALFALALLPRLYVALAWAREPVWDGHYYDFGARRI
ncbi:MAG TPA: hypothetical protein VFS00_10395, partial [Polyangiaceae bacterium]|nr:hypothetical protein [Polyangiaceae bacterium]